MTEGSSLQWVSGFWRRISALVVDTLILAAFGSALGQFLDQTFVELGGAGRFVGFFIALTYFGVMNSKLCAGQTFGKKLLKIQVVDSKNGLISVGRSFSRYAILGVPFFINGTGFANDLMMSYWAYPLSLVIVGGLLSIVYLYLFNRVTRQSLHDLMTGTYVVNKDIEPQIPGEVWRSHFVVVSILLIFSLVVPLATSPMLQGSILNNLLAVQSAIQKVPPVLYAESFAGKSTYRSSTGEQSTSTYINTRVFLNKDLTTDTELARNIADVVIGNYPGASQRNVITVTLSYGYDIGIYSIWENQKYTYNPNEL